MKDLPTEIPHDFGSWKAPEFLADTESTVGAPCNVRDILESKWTPLVRTLVPALEKGWQPTRDETAAVFRRYIKDSLKLENQSLQLGMDQALDNNDEIKKRNIQRLLDLLHNVPLPNITDEVDNLPLTIEQNSDNNDFYVLEQDPNRKLFPGGYEIDTQEDYEAHDLQLCIECYLRLPKEEQKTMLPELAPYFMHQINNESELRHLVSQIFPENYSTLSDREKVEMAKPLLDAYYTYHDGSYEYPDKDEAALDYNYLPPERINLRALFKINEGSEKDNEKTLKPWFLYLSEQEDFDKIRTHIGSLISPVEYPAILNTVRDILKNEELSDKARDNMLKLGRVLLGYDPADTNVEFFTSLAKLYKSIKFENYKPNQSSTAIEADIVEATAGSEKGKKILVLACGTGRHVAELERRQQGLEEKNIYMGLEANDRHVEIAQENLVKAGGSPEQIIEGNWNAIPVADNQLQQVESKGRDLPHAETVDALLRVRDEVYRVLEPGGVFGFDIANPNKGEYVRAQEQFHRALELLHVPAAMRQHARNMNLEYIIDGPGVNDGKVFVYNRVNPSPEQVVEIMERPHLAPSVGKVELPFQCVEIKREEIPGTGNEDIYYIALKPDPAKLEPQYRDMIAQYEQEYPELRKQLDAAVSRINDLKIQKQTQFGETKTIEEFIKQHEKYAEGENDVSIEEKQAFKDINEALHRVEEEFHQVHQALMMKNMEIRDVMPEIQKQLHAQVEVKKQLILAEMKRQKRRKRNLKNREA